ncbi:MAG TPA: 30S ribosome-binding factor RbfA [Verrucomicrobiota bacterium]|nr:30S ribosome-binding factor RbfA [Verrucomicrobiota bacterium]
MQHNRRHDRVRELIKRAAGEVIRKMFPVQEAGIISVTDVGISNDLRSAVVFLSIFSPENMKQKAFHMMREKTKLIQMQIARDVVLKYTPQIRFELDDSIDRGNRVMEILEQLEKEGIQADSPESDD